MKVSSEIFPFYDECKAKFGVDINNNVVFTYGDTIHARCHISPDLLVHEMVHERQQFNIGKDRWWKTYLIDDKFRLDQELQAYKAQYNYLKGKNRENNHRLLHHFATILSGSMYGGIINLKEAIEKLK